MAKLDWKLIELRAVSVGTLMRLARNLSDPDEENKEYARALVELIVQAAGLSMGDKQAIARRLGLKDDAS